MVKNHVGDIYFASSGLLPAVPDELLARHFFLTTELNFYLGTILGNTFFLNP